MQKRGKTAAPAKNAGPAQVLAGGPFCWRCWRSRWCRWSKGAAGGTYHRPVRVPGPVHPYHAECREQDHRRAPELYKELYDIQRDSAGQIVSVACDTLRLNQLQNDLEETLSKSLDSLGRAKLAVPLGTLTGVQALAAWGRSLRCGQSRFQMWKAR